MKGTETDRNLILNGKQTVEYKAWLNFWHMETNLKAKVLLEWKNQH